MASVHAGLREWAGLAESHVVLYPPHALASVWVSPLQTVNIWGLTLCNSCIWSLWALLCFTVHKWSSVCMLFFGSNQNPMVRHSWCGLTGGFPHVRKCGLVVRVDTTVDEKFHRCVVVCGLVSSWDKGSHTFNSAVVISYCMLCSHCWFSWGFRSDVILGTGIPTDTFQSSVC